LTGALRTEIDHFFYCIEQSDPPITGGEAGLRVERLLEATSQSVMHHGCPMQVKHYRASRDVIGAAQTPRLR
jgi:hypothetical protein